MIVLICILKYAQMNNLKRHTVWKIILRGNQAGDWQSLYPTAHKENEKTGVQKWLHLVLFRLFPHFSHCPLSSPGSRSNRSSAPNLISHITTTLLLPRVTLISFTLNDGHVDLALGPPHGTIWGVIVPWPTLPASLLPQIPETLRQRKPKFRPWS